MNHDQLTSAYGLLASEFLEQSDIIVHMKLDYDELSAEKNELKKHLEKIAEDFPRFIKQMAKLEDLVFGSHSKSYDNVMGKKLKYQDLFELMQAIKTQLYGMNKAQSEEKKKKEKPEGEGETEEKKAETGPEKAQGEEKDGDTEKEEKKQVKHKDGNPNLVHVPKELSSYVGGSIEHLVVMVDTFYRSPDDLQIIQVTTDLRDVAVLSDAEYYFSLEYILGHVYPCMRISVRLKSHGEMLRNIHHGTIASQCLCSPSLGSALVSRRFNLALPMARLEKHEFDKMGLTTDRSQVYDWMDLCAYRYLRYIPALMMEKMLERDVLIFDETYGKTREAGQFYYWDTRTSENENAEQLISFFYSRSHSAAIARFLTHGFHGYLCADGLEAYEIAACEGSGIKLCSCWNHARSYLADAFIGKDGMEKLKNGLAYTDYVLLEECIDLIREMFHLDSTYKEGDQEIYEIIRSTEIIVCARKVIGNLKEIQQRNIEYQYNGVVQDAVDYVLSREASLLRFAEDVRIPLSTNSLETQHAMVAVGRNNFYLFDSENGARTGSHCYSVAAKARIDGVSVQDYFEFLLEFLPVVLDMHKEEVDAYDSYEKKSLALVEDALKWQKAHPGKRANLDFSSLGERPSLKFLEPYLCGNDKCLFEEWQKAKNESRKNLSIQIAQDISKENLQACGLSEDTLRRILNSGLKSQAAKEDIIVGLESMEKCLDEIQAKLDSTAAQNNLKFHPAFVFETTGKLDSSVPQEEDRPESEQSDHIDEQEGCHNESGNDGVGSDTGLQEDGAPEGGAGSTDPASPVLESPDSLDTPGSDGSSVDAATDASEPESMGRSGGSDAEPGEESLDPGSDLQRDPSMEGGAGSSAPGSPGQGITDPGNGEFSAGKATAASEPEPLGRSSGSSAGPGTESLGPDSDLPGDLSMEGEAGSSASGSPGQETSVALNAPENSTDHEDWPESQRDDCHKAASATAGATRDRQHNSAKAEHHGRTESRGKAPP